MSKFTKQKMNIYTNFFRNCVRYKSNKFFDKKKSFARQTFQDPEAESKLPIFEYYSKNSLNPRVYVWGRTETGALGLNVNRTKHAHSANKPIRLTFAEQHNVVDFTCGYGFTVFVVNDKGVHKLHGCGINTDSQIGSHFVRGTREKGLGYVLLPQEITLPLREVEKCEIFGVAAGRAHLLVNTNEGLFTLGNNSYGQCGREIITDEKYSSSSVIHNVRFNEEPIHNVYCGQDHSFVLTKSGRVYSCGWGADGQTGLGHYRNESKLTLVEGDICSEQITKIACTSDCVLALSEKGEVFGWGNSEYGQIPLDAQQVHTPAFINSKWGKIVDIAAGGSFCMVLNDQGEVFVWGYGLLGLGPNVQQSDKPLQLVSSLLGRNEFDPNCKVVKIGAGLSHMVALNSNGDLYSWGRNTAGNLGLGHMNDQYFPFKISIGAFVKTVKCSVDHTICICEPFT